MEVEINFELLIRSLSCRRSSSYFHSACLVWNFHFMQK